MARFPGSSRKPVHDSAIPDQGEIMGIKQLFAVCVLWLGMHAVPALAEGVFIAAPSRVDMVYDDQRDLVYISSGTQVLRYRVATASFLQPIELGGELSGIDLSPDGKTLAVADRSSNGSQLWVNAVRLDDLHVSKLVAEKADELESGTWAVSFAFDGSLYATSRFSGSGWVQMRRFDVDTGAVSPLAEIMQDTMLASSGDGKTIAFAEANISDGRWGLYDVPTGGIVRRQWYDDGTSWFNYEISADAMGGQFAIPTYGGTYIYNEVYQHIATLGEYAGPQPIAAAYHPVEPLIFFPWAQTREVRVYDSLTLQPVDSFDFEDDFQATGNAFEQGRTRLSRDGSLLMVSVAGGVRILRMYAPLSADSVSTMNNRRVNNVRLAGAIGNGGRLAYSIASQPAHGRVVAHGNYATYMPYGSYRGVDSFRYRVHYGQATVEAVVTVNAAAAMKTLQQPDRNPHQSMPELGTARPRMRRPASAATAERP
jgi:hypothetical protein